MKHKHRVVRTPQYEENFDIDISQENIGQVFEVLAHDGQKYKVEVVDPKKYLVRATKQVDKKESGKESEFAEGQITVGKNKRANLAPFTSLPSPKGYKHSIIVEKLRRL